MKGKIIVIDGMDGTGKATQSKLLYEDLKGRGMKVKLFSFPNYDSDSSYFVKKFLREGYTRDIDDPMLHSIYFSIDRAITYAHEIKKYYEDGYIIIMDRYTISNVICNLPRNIGYECEKKYIWDLRNIEYELLKLPRPDLNIILFSDPEVNDKLMDNDNRDKRDLNENLASQKKFYENIKYLSEKDKINKDISISLGNVCFVKIHDYFDEELVLYTEEEMHSKIMRYINKAFQLYLDIE